MPGKSDPSKCFDCLHETQGDFFQTTPSNQSYRFAAYKHFIWFVYIRLGKRNRWTTLPPVVWKISETFPEEDGLYIPYTEE